MLYPMNSPKRADNDETRRKIHELDALPSHTRYRRIRRLEAAGEALRADEVQGLISSEQHDEAVANLQALAVGDSFGADVVAELLRRIPRLHAGKLAEGVEQVVEIDGEVEVEVEVEAEAAGDSLDEWAVGLLKGRSVDEVGELVENLPALPAGVTRAEALDALAAAEETGKARKGALAILDRAFDKQVALDEQVALDDDDDDDAGEALLDAELDARTDGDG